MSKIDNKNKFKLGEWWVDPERNRIEYQSESLVVEYRVMDLLVYLASRAGEVVSAEDIHNNVWRNVIVGDHSLYQSIAQLRKALKDNATQPKYIETIPKKGYRLIAKVETIGDDESDDRNSKETIPPIQVNAKIPEEKLNEIGQPGFASRIFKRLPSNRLLVVSLVVSSILIVIASVIAPEFGPSPRGGAMDFESIAVLPFVNLSDNEKENYFAQGIAEELLNGLARVPGLKVVARTSSFSLSNVGDVRLIGKQLNVDTVLEGSVRKAGGKIRISVQLINTADGFHRWSNTYEVESNDIFAIEDTIAEEVVKALNMSPRLLANADLVQSTTNDVQAYDFYILGLNYLHGRNQESLKKAIEFIQKAITLDNTYALAYATLAKAYLRLSLYGDLSVEQATALAQPAIEQAMQLDTELADAHVSLGLLNLLRYKYTEAESEFKIAIELSPSNASAYMWLGQAAASQGRLREAQTILEQAQRLDPLNVRINSNLAYNLTRMGRYDDAIERLLAIHESRPEDIIILLDTAEIGYAIGKLDIANRFAEKAIKLNPENIHAMALLARIAVASGQLEKASLWVERARQTAQSDSLLIVMRAQAEIHVFKGEFAKLDALMRTFENKKTESHPSLFFQRYWNMRGFVGVAKLLVNDYAKAAKYFEKVLRDSHGLTLASEGDVYYRVNLAYAFKKLGKDARFQTTLDMAKEVIAQAHQNGWKPNELTYQEARLKALEGQADLALTQLEKAVSEGYSAYWWILNDPVMNPLKANPSFGKLISELTIRLGKPLTS